MVQTRHTEEIPGLAVEGRQEAVVMGREGGHGDLALVAQRPRVGVVGVERVFWIIFLCVVEHHVLFDLQDIGEALGALFDLAGDQRLYVDGAAILQLLDFCHVLLGVGLFPLGPNTGIDNPKFTGSHKIHPFMVRLYFSQTGTARKTVPA